MGDLMRYEKVLATKRTVMFFPWKDSLTPRKQAVAELSMVYRVARKSNCSRPELFWRRLLRAEGDIVELVAEWKEEEHWPR